MCVWMIGRRVCGLEMLLLSSCSFLSWSQLMSLLPFEVKINVALGSNGRMSDRSVTGNKCEPSSRWASTKHSATPRPRSELLIRLWWGRQAMFLQGGEEPWVSRSLTQLPFTKSSIQCVFHFLHRFQTERTVFCFQQHWSAWAAGTGDIRGKMIS